MKNGYSSLFALWIVCNVTAFSSKLASISDVASDLRVAFRNSMYLQP